MGPAANLWGVWLKFWPPSREHSVAREYSQHDQAGGLGTSRSQRSAAGLFGPTEGGRGALQTHSSEPAPQKPPDRTQVERPAGETSPAGHGAPRQVPRKIARPPVAPDVARPAHGRQGQVRPP